MDIIETITYANQKICHTNLEMLLSCNNKKKTKMVHQRSNVGDISPALSQSFTPVSIMANSHSAKWQQHTVPTQRCFITHCGGSDIDAASYIVENHSHLLMTGVTNQKKMSKTFRCRLHR